jgi:hypothetical protein
MGSRILADGRRESRGESDCLGDCGDKGRRLPSIDDDAAVEPPPHDQHDLAAWKGPHFDEHAPSVDVSNDAAP